MQKCSCGERVERDREDGCHGRLWCVTGYGGAGMRGIRCAVHRHRRGGVVNRHRKGSSKKEKCDEATSPAGVTPEAEVRQHRRQGSCGPRVRLLADVSGGAACARKVRLTFQAVTQSLTELR